MNVIKSIFSIVIMFSLLIIFTNCGNKNTLTKDENEIISLLINESFNSYFKIPKEYKENLDKSKFFINNKFVVVIDVKMNPIQHKFSLKEFQGEYQLLYDKLFLLKDTLLINVENLKVHKNISCVPLNEAIEENLKQNVDYSNFHELVTFSRIAFNEKRNKAILAMGESTSSLAGTYDLCFLKKENNIWKIIGFRNISIS